MTARRSWLAGLNPLYGAGLRAKNELYDSSFLRARKLSWPVISVGSLSAGGAGKTPVVVMLARLLERHGVEVDVLSRGYGRSSGAVEEVDAVGTAEQFGDEPLEMAQAGLRVFVGADRWAAGTLAESKEPRSQSRDLENPEFGRGGRLHVLDDGFQHRRLGRALDVVLLTAVDADDWLLPGGDLREPLASLGRASVVVLRAEEAERLRPLVSRDSRAEIWVIRRKLVLPESRLHRPVVFCGIARPEGFLRMLEEVGCEAAGQVVFGDHHRYGAKDIERILATARQVAANGFYTTAKDAVKLTPRWQARLGEIGPVEVAGLTISLEDEAKAIGTMLRAVRGSE